MTFSRIKPAWLLSISVFSILFAATYRDDADGSSFGAGGDFSDVVQLPIVGVLKHISVFAFIVPVLASFVAIIAKFPAARVLGWLTSILTFLVIFLMVRLLPEAPSVSGKILVTTMVISLMVTLAMCTAGTKEANAVPTAIFAGAFTFAVMHSLFNAGLVLTGFGTHRSRFLGTSMHPNFIGVQMACCAVLMLGGLRGRIGRRLFTTIGIAAALIALVAAGSRTGLIVFGVGFFVFWSVRGLKLWQAIALLIIIITLLCCIIVFSNGNFNMSMDQYDRGGVNTRADAWQEMWQMVIDSPIIGAGLYPQASESSYLRGWAAVGILYVFSYFCFLIAAIRAIFRGSRRSTRPVQSIAFIALIFALMAGGVLEGYLLDTLSFPIIILVAATLSVDSFRPTKAVVRTLAQVGDGLRFANGTMRVDQARAPQ